MIPATGNPQGRTNRSFLDSALANLAEATKRKNEARRGYHSLMHGEPEVPRLLREATIAAADEEHWRREVAHWRAQCVEEGEEHVPPLQWVPPKAGRAPNFLADPKLDADPIVVAERAARRQAQLELEQLAKAAAREGREAGDDDDEPLGNPREAAF